jgi:hypothetical protein
MRLTACSAALTFIICTLPEGGEARTWKPDACMEATDYTQIYHDKSPERGITIWWFAPETIPDDPGSDDVKSMLREYMVVGVSDFEIDAFGRFVAKTPGDVVVETATGKRPEQIAEDRLPPFLFMLLTGLRSMCQQGLGTIGEGMEFFVFEGSNIESCGPGRFSIRYDGEDYEYETPIPGCPDA